MKISIIPLEDDSEVFVDCTNPILNSVVDTVRQAFGSEMTREDIIAHLKNPQKRYLATDDSGRIAAMAGYSQHLILGSHLLFVDGVAIHPDFQGAGLFRELTNMALENEEFIGLRTQNPRMYRAIEKISQGGICPSASCQHLREGTEKELKRLCAIKNALCAKVGFSVDFQGVIRGCYGRSLYGEVPQHNRTTPLFQEVLKVNYERGDSVVCVGRLKI